MQSISATLHGIMMQNKFGPINLIYSNELYCDSPRLFNWLAKNYTNVNLVSVDVAYPQKIVALFQEKLLKQVNVLFIEACSNPNGKIFDFTILQKLGSLSKSLTTIVDNTWLTETIFNPFSVKQVDYVVSSMTKYYSAGTCIGGYVLARSKNSMKNISEWMIVNGNHVSPLHCELVHQHLSDIDTRIQSSSKLTKKIITEHLSKHPKVLQINHPIISTHPTHALVAKYFSKVDDEVLVPSVFTFKVKGTKSQILDVLTRVKIIEHKTSFGSKLSRTDPWPTEKDGNTLIRLAVGFEDDYDRVVKGLDEILDLL
ncbi:PLP dependent aminotransferase domain-containing protein [Naegleria gruberi]|uniref:PLP dependent aminotransferase domain-containing protein n=1 Tax=Naegleria gruberi TaxID=5762 RepID=D2VRF6_NAEGR|nr:PLP dependent aminotransferase domain-containing protein [Naegleria gruberi]EFC40661.1 PLP dependent aminotransferase domain-containing protein [Naegleria gruberi]|eukprot:XP_002673405.1 PLP dependent aminotransferase domain-containing protein [Naegleria gruberi strain NEG-M]